jgi:DNA mismatch repair protein MutS2
MPPLPPLEELDALLFQAEAGADVPEVDLHGMRADEAVSYAEQLLQSSFVSGERVIRLIHGKGEGRLRESLHSWLRTHRLVARWREAASGGVTLVALVEH